jgi:hypothetical protein
MTVERTLIGQDRLGRPAITSVAGAGRGFDQLRSDCDKNAQATPDVGDRRA